MFSKLLAGDFLFATFSPSLTVTHRQTNLKFSDQWTFRKLSRVHSSSQFDAIWLGRQTLHPVVVLFLIFPSTSPLTSTDGHTHTQRKSQPPWPRIIHRQNQTSGQHRVVAPQETTIPLQSKNSPQEKVQCLRYTLGEKVSDCTPDILWLWPGQGIDSPEPVGVHLCEPLFLPVSSIDFQPEEHVFFVRGVFGVCGTRVT